MSRRRVREPELTVIAWRDIPAQVVARHGVEAIKATLSPRFQAAIDRAAMIADLTGTDAYLDEWTQTTVVCGADLALEVAQRIADIESAIDADTLAVLVTNGGRSPDSSPSQEKT